MRRSSSVSFNKDPDLSQRVLRCRCFCCLFGCCAFVRLLLIGGGLYGIINSTAGFRCVWFMHSYACITVAHLLHVCVQMRLSNAHLNMPLESTTIHNRVHRHWHRHQKKKNVDHIPKQVWILRHKNPSICRKQFSVRFCQTRWQIKSANGRGPWPSIKFLLSSLRYNLFG